jgi:hypothetical protein
MKTIDLRTALDAIVNSGAVAITEQPAAVVELGTRIAHSIVILDGEIDRPYNCFTFVLGLIENDRVYELLRKDADWYGYAGIRVGPEFVARLIEAAVLARDDDGRLVVYFRNDKPVHAGIVRGNQIRSKWGIGHLWEHGLWEVPSSYGDRVERCNIARPEQLQPQFEAYASALIAAKGGYPD